MFTVKIEKRSWMTKRSWKVDGREKVMVVKNQSSSSNREYETVIWSDGLTSCNCPGWTMVKPGRGRGCKHTKAIGKKVA